MTRSCKITVLALVLLCAATITTAAAAHAAGRDVDSYNFPVFDSTTTYELVVATNLSILSPASLLFDPFFPKFNICESEGFLLLWRTVDVWRADAGAGSDGTPTIHEASFNTSFTVEGSASPVSFVVLLDKFPTLNNPASLRGDSVAGVMPNATNGLTTVVAGTVRSYAPESPNVGLNVTIFTPNGTAAVTPRRRTMWIEYDAVVHLLRVYVATVGEPKPPNAILDTSLSLAGSRTTNTALVGFFAATVRDVILNVRDWKLTVDRFPTDDGKKGTSWWVILVAVLGSVAATAAIVSVVVCYFVSRRRRRNMEPKQ